MKRKTTELEEILIKDGWQLVLKRYVGKRSEKTLCYEYHKTSDIRNESKTFDQIIKLDQKRSQIIDYGVKNVCIDFLNEEELCFIKFLYLELKRFVEKLDGVVAKGWYQHKLTEDKGAIIPINVPNSELDERQQLPPMTPEQFDELCEEMEKNNNE